MLRLVGAVLAEQHDEWAVGRRYLSLESLADADPGAAPSPGIDVPKEVLPELTVAR